MDKLQLIELTAQTAHEVNRAYCQSIGDDSQPSWSDAPEWQRSSARVGVTGIFEGRIATPEQSHQSWLDEKEINGWKYGPVKDPEKREHPCFVPYHQLSAEQQVKDALFFAVVTTFAPLALQTEVNHDTQRLDWLEHHARNRAAVIGAKLTKFEELTAAHGIREVIDEMKRQQETPSQAR